MAKSAKLGHIRLLLEVDTTESANNDDDEFSVYERYTEIADRYEDKMMEHGQMARDSRLSADVRIDHLNQLLDLYNRFQVACKESPKVWNEFSAMYLHCHNSKDPDFVWISQYYSLLEYLEKNRERLNRDTAFLNEALPHLPNQVLQFIKDHPGVKQADMYKQFDSRLKAHISELLYFSAKSGSITRTKAGNTYQLYPKEQN